jgi:hypothetical protein
MDFFQNNKGDKALIEFHVGVIRVNADLEDRKDIEVMITALKALSVLLPDSSGPVAPPEPIDVTPLPTIAPTVQA